MKTFIKANLMSLFLLIGLTGFSRLVAAGSFEQGMSAFQLGNYMAAFRIWTPLAKKGDALSQYNLGVMCYEGYGISQDYVEAAKWFHKAAVQKNADAQRNLGVMYYEGKGVSQDDVRAYMWFNRAVIYGSKEGIKDRNMIAKRMTFTQISEAQKLAREWSTTQGSQEQRKNNVER